VVKKGSVQRLKVVVRRPRPIRRPVAPVLLAVVYEAAPNDEAAERAQRFPEHVGPFGMISSIREGTGPVFGIGFDEKSAEIRNESVDVRHPLAPPLPDGGIEGIGSGQSANFHWTGVV